MKKFMDEDFLLETETAKHLYHDYVERLPIFDFHCHLNVKDIMDDRHFSSITELWLVDGSFGDHYKWRQMRNFGVKEEYITGDKDNYSKFIEWVKTLNNLQMNPLYHWSYLELKRYFNIEEELTLDNAKFYYDKMNSFLKNHGVKDILKMMNIDTICTTDDPIDNLFEHDKIKEDKSFNINVVPAFRPDKVLNINLDSFIPYIDKLSSTVGFTIDSIYNLLEALNIRIDYFNSKGCFLSDHALDTEFFIDATKEEVNNIYKKALNKESLTVDEISKYKGYVLTHLAKEYSKYNWAMQLHMNSIRNNNTYMYKELGPDTGFDAIGTLNLESSLKGLFDKLYQNNTLPKTILYSLNPNDYDWMLSLGLCYSKDVKGKIQLGSAWWFNDTKAGMERQLETLSGLGMISLFVGMLTDSRSFLSYPRHEYFRRILCNMIGRKVENGEIFNNDDKLKEIVQNISYYNSKSYLNK